MKLIKINLKHIIRHFGFKISLYIATLYILLISCSLCITLIAFITIGNFKHTIENLALKYSGYEIHMGDLHSEISNNYSPEIIIDDFKLKNPHNNKQAITIHQIHFAFAYASIWQFTPILDNLKIIGSNINIEYLKNNNIAINGFIINPRAKSAHKKHKFNFEELILKQKYISISNINTSFCYPDSSLPQINFNNIAITLKHGLFNSHDLAISFGDNSINKPLDVELSWVGDTFGQLEKWKKASLIIKSVAQKDTFFTSISQYLPHILALDNFNSNNIVAANLENGRLTSFYANFNVNNLALSLPHSLQKIKLPKIGGIVKINLNKANHYIISAENLTLSTDKGYVFDNKNITGNYLVNHVGTIKLIDIELESFNNIFKLIPQINKISISGKLDIVNFTWFGNVFTPMDIQLKTIFSNLSIVSKNPYIPSLNNISGNIDVSRHKGHAVINLKNSTLDYKYMFLAPYKFKSVNSELTWQESSNKSIVFTLNKGDIKSVDFNSEVSGTYTYTPSTLGYLDLTAKIDRVEAHKIGNYLPKVIGVPVLQWLNTALIGGYGKNGKLLLKGNLADFPFNNNKGIFYIDADIEKGNLLFADAWPPINDIIGNFQIRNQKIIILASTATSLNNQIESVSAIVPDMTANQVYLTVSGRSHGNTPNFIQYLIQSPLNKILGKFPEKVTANGKGSLQVALKVPFDNLTKTSVNGLYTFEHNNLQINLPIPPLTEVNGNLNFFESGIWIKNISANAFTSNLLLTATTTNNIMHFHVSSNNLDYQKAGSFYLPLLKPIIRGNANTNINFNIDSSGLDNLSLNSNLSGVQLDAPDPLHKNESASIPFNLQLAPNNNGFDIKFAYNNDLLNAKVALNHDGELTKANINVGTTGETTVESASTAKIIMNIKTKILAVVPWINTIKQILATTETEDRKQLAEYSSLCVENCHPGQGLGSTTRTKKTAADKSTVNPNLPIEIILRTQHILIGTHDVQQLQAHTLVTNEAITFNLKSTLTSGYGEYTYKNKNLNIKLYNFSILKSTESSVKSKARNTTANNSSTPKAIESMVNAKTTINNQTWIDFSKLNLERASSQKSIFESQGEYLSYTMADSIEKESNASGIPNTTINIDKLYYESNVIGKLYVVMTPSGKNLLFKNNTLNGQSLDLNFAGINSCFKCYDALTDVTLHAKIKDLGDLLEKLNYGKIVSKGSGRVDSSIEWNGDVSDFRLHSANIRFKIAINDGTFLKVDTGSVFGRILGLINLQTITNLIKLDFGRIFSNGFYFNSLTLKGRLSHNILDLKSMIMHGPMASVKMYGNINLWNENINLHVVIIPHLSAGVAVGAAVATGPAGIIVGPAVYAAEELFNQPFSKLFSFSYHITGTLDKPNMEKEDLSKQIMNNVSSTVDL